MREEERRLRRETEGPQWFIHKHSRLKSINTLAETGHGAPSTWRVQGPQVR